MVEDGEKLGAAEASDPRKQRREYQNLNNSPDETKTQQRRKAYLIDYYGDEKGKQKSGDFGFRGFVSCLCPSKSGAGVCSFHIYNTSIWKAHVNHLAPTHCLP